MVMGIAVYNFLCRPWVGVYLPTKLFGKPRVRMPNPNRPPIRIRTRGGESEPNPNLASRNRTEPEPGWVKRNRTRTTDIQSNFRSLNI